MLSLPLPPCSFSMSLSATGEKNAAPVRAAFIRRRMTKCIPSMQA